MYLVVFNNQGNMGLTDHNISHKKLIGSFIYTYIFFYNISSPLKYSKEKQSGVCDVGRLLTFILLVNWHQFLLFIFNLW